MEMLILVWPCVPALAWRHANNIMIPVSLTVRSTILQVDDRFANG
jgi:hypothetical protein